jgi:hypothetical protein
MACEILNEARPVAHEAPSRLRLKQILIEVAHEATSHLRLKERNYIYNIRRAYRESTCIGKTTL